jgi:beta-glucosidase
MLISESVEELTTRGINFIIVTIMVSGRPRIISDDLNDWSAFVEAWLPGSEGEGVAEVIYGDTNFKGTLSHYLCKPQVKSIRKVFYYQF